MERKKRKEKGVKGMGTLEVVAVSRGKIRKGKSDGKM